MFKQLATAAVLTIATVSVASAADVMTGKTAKGPTLVNANGMTLYTFAKDKKGKSACSGQCAMNWPPVMAYGDTKAGRGLTVITRDDGGKQWAYRGKPLYLWAKDYKPGDTSGDGVNGTWHLARP